MDQKNNQLYTPSSVVYTIQANNSKFKCAACGEEGIFQKDELLLRCRIHIYCKECSQNYKRYVIDNLTTQQFPLKCISSCSSHLFANCFERLLTEKENLEYVKAMIIQTSKKESTNYIHCLFCNNLEFFDSNLEISIYYCSNPECLKAHCIVCQEQIPCFKSIEEYEQKQQENEDIDISDQQVEIFIKHSKCFSDRKYIQEFDQIIQKGSQQICPNCETSGRKDNNCTHMICDKCNQKWCYFCGLKEQDVHGQSMSSHNDNWKKDRRYCPLYLEELHRIDKRWPADDENALNFFHRIKTLNLLFNWLQQNQQQKVLLWNKYSKVKNCGFTLNEILNGDLELVQNKRNCDIF